MANKADGSQPISEEYVSIIESIHVKVDIWKS